jgi:hypothetical protein
LCCRGGCEGSKVGLTFSPHLSTSFSTPAAHLGRFGCHQPPQWLREAGGAVSGSAWLTGWCVSRPGKIPIPNPEKNQEPIVDSGSTPLGALRGWATPPAAPCHWPEHRLHKPGVAKPADDRGTLPKPAEPAVVAHDTKISKGRDSVVRIVRRPTEAQTPEAFTMARMPALTTSGSRSQAATTRARSGGSALESALLLSVTVGFPREIGGSFASCPRHFLHARRAIHGPGGLCFVLTPGLLPGSP